MLFLDDASLYCGNSSNEDKDICNEIISDGKFFGVYYTMILKYTSPIPKYMLNSFNHYVFGSESQYSLSDIKDTLDFMKLENYNNLESFFLNSTRNNGIYINRNNGIDNTGFQVYKYSIN